MSGSPTLSVVIPVYNRSHSIGRAVDSVLAQSLPASEILIIDDGSSDDLAGALARFGNRLRLIRHDTNRGAAAARNTGVEAATGELVAFLDSDDAWKPEKLAKQLAFMHRLGIDASCTGFEIVAPGASRARVARRPYPTRLSISDFVWGCYASPGSTLVVRRDKLLECGGYDTRFARYEDWDMLLRLAATCPSGIGFIGEPLATVHLGSPPSADRCRISLDLLLREHEAPLRSQNRTLARKFRSGVAFNRASVLARHNQWHAVVLELGRAFLLAPAGNWPFRVILMDRIRNRPKDEREKGETTA